MLPTPQIFRTRANTMRQTPEAFRERANTNFQDQVSFSNLFRNPIPEMTDTDDDEPKRLDPEIPENIEYRPSLGLANTIDEDISLDPAVDPEFIKDSEFRRRSRSNAQQKPDLDETEWESLYETPDELKTGPKKKKLSGNSKTKKSSGGSKKKKKLKPINLFENEFNSTPTITEYFKKTKDGKSEFDKLAVIPPYKRKSTQKGKGKFFKWINMQ